MEAPVHAPLLLAGWLRAPVPWAACARAGPRARRKIPTSLETLAPPAKDLGWQHMDQTDTACGSVTLADGGSGKAAALFQHPVRLLWPRSRSFDYLYSEGEKLLENFPVQATISLYEDSDSEEEEEGWGEEEQAEEGKQQAGETVLQEEAGCPQGRAGASQPIKLCPK